MTQGDIETALETFTGRILQEPPAFSAVKVDGKRAYKLARRGEEPRLQPREVEVYEARVLDYVPGAESVARVEIRCSSGTYLRSIARDLGRQLRVGGYLGRLVRTAYGPLAIDSAVKVDTLTSADDLAAYTGHEAISLSDRFDEELCHFSATTSNLVTDYDAHAGYYRDYF